VQSETLRRNTGAPDKMFCRRCLSHILSQFRIFRRDLLGEIAKAAASRWLSKYRDAFFRDKAVSRVSSATLC